MSTLRLLLLVLLVAVSTASIPVPGDAAVPNHPLPINVLYVDHPTDGEHIKRTANIPIVQTHFNGQQVRVLFGLEQLWFGPVNFGTTDFPLDSTLLPNGTSTLDVLLYDNSYNIVAVTSFDVSVQNAVIDAAIIQQPQLQYATAHVTVEGEPGDTVFVVLVAATQSPSYFPQWGLNLPLPVQSTGNLIFGMFPAGYTGGPINLSVNLQGHSQANALHFVMVAYRDGAWHDTTNVATARVPD
ncbi:MAG: hypothetical protein AAF581_22455 [Planctomycetota bacterium]